MARRRWGAAALLLAVALAACGDDGPASAPRLQGEVVLEDDFEDAASGFAVGWSGTGTVAYGGGKYVVEAVGPGSLKVSDTNLAGPAFQQELVELGDVSVEVDVEKVYEKDEVEMGLMCRLQPSAPAYYSAVFDLDGSWQLTRFDGRTHPLAESTKDTEVEGLDEVSEHRLRLDCLDGPDGTELAMYLDGKEVASVIDDDPLPAGRVAMAAGPRLGGTRGTARFDDLRVTAVR